MNIFMSFGILYAVRISSRTQSKINDSVNSAALAGLSEKEKISVRLASNQVSPYTKKPTEDGNNKRVSTGLMSNPVIADMMKKVRGKVESITALMKWTAYGVLLEIGLNVASLIIVYEGAVPYGILLVLWEAILTSMSFLALKMVQNLSS